MPTTPREYLDHALTHGWDASWAPHPDGTHRITVRVDRPFHFEEGKPRINAQHHSRWLFGAGTWTATETASTLGPDVNIQDLAAAIAEGSGYPSPPAKALNLIDAAIANGWRLRVRHAKDSAGAPYLTVTAGVGNEANLEVTWHTRDSKSGAYRFFSALTRGEKGGWRDATLTRALDLIEDLSPNAQAAA